MDRDTEIARRLLEHAETFRARREAVKEAQALGMSLHDIEKYLDYLDALRSQLRDVTDQPGADGAEGAR